MAGNDVEMQMEHRLSGRRFVELGDEHTIGVEESLTALATFWTTVMAWVRVVGSASRMLREGAFGTTSTWPGACGITSMKATVYWSS